MNTTPERPSRKALADLTTAAHAAVRELAPDPFEPLADAAKTTVGGINPTDTLIKAIRHVMATLPSSEPRMFEAFCVTERLANEGAYHMHEQVFDHDKAAFQHRARLAQLLTLVDAPADTAS